MSWQVVSLLDPEPLTLAEAKSHLRVDFSDDDVLIAALISATRQYAEGITWRAIPRQQRKLVLDAFPAPSAETSSANWYGPQWGTGPGPLTVLRPSGRSGYELYLPGAPVISVDTIKYLQDTDGTQQTLSSANYIVDNVSEPCRVVPSYSNTWPATRAQANAVEITFTCGYATVPEGIKAWMKVRLGALYENREEVALMNRGKIEPLPFVDGLLDPFRAVVY